MDHNEQGRSVSGGDGPAATTTSPETKVEVDRTTGDAVAEDSREGGGNEAPADQPTAKKIKFTSKIRRGLALVRMVTMASLRDNMPPAQTIIDRWTKKQQAEFNAALEWMESEEDWECVADAWAKAGGRVGAVDRSAGQG